MIPPLINNFFSYFNKKMHALIYTFYLKSNGKNPYFGQKDIKPFFNFISLAKTLPGSFISKIILKTLGTIWRIFLLCHWYSCNFLKKKKSKISWTKFMIAYLHLFDYGWGIQTHFYIQNPSVFVELFLHHQTSCKSWQHNTYLI